MEQTTSEDPYHVLNGMAPASQTNHVQLRMKGLKHGHMSVQYIGNIRVCHVLSTPFLVVTSIVGSSIMGLGQDWTVCSPAYYLTYSALQEYIVL